jgi:hypothetical protein
LCYQKWSFEDLSGGSQAERRLTVIVAGLQ